MSGSGACCFAGFDEQSAALAALAKLPADMKGFVARGLDSHPLLNGAGNRNPGQN
jgi:4-diphosphocytidyl-2-C-methyl-D-erythritol kinase